MSTSPRTTQPTRLLSVTQVAEQLSCSRGHVYGLIAAKAFKTVEIKAKGTRPKTRLLADEVEAFIERSTRSVG